VTGANSPARLATLVSKDSKRLSDNLVCSAASNRALVNKTGERPESGSGWLEERKIARLDQRTSV
jgi:hypothetical protein